MQRLMIAIRAFFAFTVLLGLLYPLFIVVTSKIIFPYQADGSLIEASDTIIGSELIAQEFTARKYFHSRFSAVNYDAKISGASQLAVSNGKLFKILEKNIKHVRTENSIKEDIVLPADMVQISASGLDPHISLENAMLQLSRVVKHRSLSRDTIKQVIRENFAKDFIGIWGQGGINVLKLNLAMDKLEAKRKQSSSDKTNESNRK